MRRGPFADAEGGFERHSNVDAKRSGSLSKKWMAVASSEDSTILSHSVCVAALPEVMGGSFGDENPCEEADMGAVDKILSQRAGACLTVHAPNERQMRVRAFGAACVCARGCITAQSRAAHLLVGQTIQPRLHAPLHQCLRCRLLDRQLGVEGSNVGLRASRRRRRARGDCAALL